MFQFRCAGCGYVFHSGLPPVEALSLEQSLVVGTFNADKHWSFFGSIYEGLSETNLCSFCLIAFVDNQELFEKERYAQLHSCEFGSPSDMPWEKRGFNCMSCSFKHSWPVDKYDDAVFASRSIMTHKIVMARGVAVNLYHHLLEGVIVNQQKCVIEGCNEYLNTTQTPEPWFCYNHALARVTERQVKLLMTVDHPLTCKCVDCKWIDFDDAEMSYDVAQEASTHVKIIWLCCPNGHSDGLVSKMRIHEVPHVPSYEAGIYSVEVCVTCGVEATALQWVDPREEEEV